MKIESIECPNCGGGLHIVPNSKIVTCEHCGKDVLINDEVIRVAHRIEDAEQAGYEFEKGRQRAKREETANWQEPRRSDNDGSIVSAETAESSGSGCVLVFIMLIILWFSLCTFCGFVG